MESGGFYGFGGAWDEQTNKGVEWLTAHDNKMSDNVCRPKTARLGRDKNLLAYEVWTDTEYVIFIYMLTYAQY